MFRRAKLQLDAIPPATLENAVELGLPVGRLGLTDPRATLCALPYDLSARLGSRTRRELTAH
jgi:hypothetical protein